MSAVPPSPVVPTGRRVEVGRVESADALIGGDDAEVVIVVRVVLDHQTVTELSLGQRLVDHDFVPAVAELPPSAANLIEKDIVDYGAANGLELGVSWPVIGPAEPQNGDKNNSYHTNHRNVRGFCHCLSHASECEGRGKGRTNSGCLL